MVTIILIDIGSMFLDELKVCICNLGEPSYRAKQIYDWLVKGATNFDDMLNVPKSLREKI